MKKIILLSLISLLCFCTSAQNATKPNFLRGCVGYWSYAGNGYVSTVGSWYDRSGNGNIATLHNDAYVDNQGCHYDGTGDYTDCGNDSSLNLTTTHTVEFWFKAESTQPNTYPKIVWNVISWIAGRGVFYFGINDDRTLVYRTSYNTTNYDIYTSSTVNDAEWHHAVGIKNGTTMYLYFDGELVGSTNCAATSSSSTGNTTIGGNGGGATDTLNGIIAVVRIYNRALTASEIKQIYHATKGLHN